MSDDPQQPNPDPGTAPAAPEQAASPEKPAGTPEPPWGKDFDPQRAYDTIQRLRDENKDAKSLEQHLKKAGVSVEDALSAIAEVEKVRDEKRTDVERLQGEMTKATELATANEERANAFRDRAVAAEVRAAAREFANPDDAVALLGDLSGFVKDSEIATEDIASAVSKLAEDRPYLLGAGHQGPRRMAPNPAQGQSGAPNLTPTQAAKAAEGKGDYKAAASAKADQLLQLRNSQQ